MQNPLLDLEARIQFDRIEPVHVVPAVTTLIAKAKAALDAIATDSSPPTYESTLGALERATEPLELSMSVIEHLESVSTTDDLRTAHNAVVPEVSDFWSSIPLHEGLYRRLRAFGESAEAKTLEPTRARFLEKTLDEFKRQGAELGAEGKEKLRGIDKELSLLTTKFTQNVLDSTNGFELVLEDAARLGGLPESALDMARESAEAKGRKGYRFTLQAPSVTAVLTYADDRALRETIWRAFNRRAAEGTLDNRALIVEIVRCRRERAQILGFRDFAELTLTDRMAKTTQEARRFIDELTHKTLAAFEREKTQLEVFAKNLDGSSALSPWDVGYYSEKQRKALYDFDEEKLKPYFPADRVLDGAFKTAQRLYGINIEADPSLPTWHPTAVGYRITDQTGMLGSFYVDLYPRESKRDGAWMHGILAAVPPRPHLAVFCMNGNPPSGGRPSLMSHRDVETLFHEFGHLLHHCLSRVGVRSLSCTRVAHDFVELPSQIMENWVQEAEGLNLFARHYETGEPIPEELLEKLLRARTYRAASAQMRQLGFASVDLALHVDFDPARDGDVITFARGVLQKFAPTPFPDDYSMLTSFSHLFAHPVGYAAGYYAYKWAEVLDADTFGRFKEQGLFSREAGNTFREHILAKGDSEEPMVLFERFRGRKPKLEPLLARQGLTEAPSP